MTLFLPKDKQPGSSPHDRSPPLGRIHFRLRYDLDKSDLHVHMIEGEPNIAQYIPLSIYDDVLGNIWNGLIIGTLDSVQLTVQRSICF